MPGGSAKHKTFADDEDRELEVEVGDAAPVSSSTRGRPARRQDLHDSDEDSDEAPEAVSTSLSKQRETKRSREAQLLAEKTRAAKRKANRAREENIRERKRSDAAAALPDVKGKGRHQEGEEEFEDPEEDPNSSQRGLPSSTGTNDVDDGAGAGVSNSISNKATSQGRLDPSLFTQADQALAVAKELARRNEERGAQLGEVARVGRNNKRKVDFSDDDAEEVHQQKRATKVIGNVTVQQLPDTDAANLSAGVDPSTALPSKQSDIFMRKSLYKPKKNRAGKRGGDAAGKGKGKAQKESEFLLFDPLLDKKPEGKDGKTKGKKPLNRIELEEQRRGRRNAQTSYLKSNPLAAKMHLGFAVDKPSLKRRRSKQKDKKAE